MQANTKTIIRPLKAFGTLLVYALLLLVTIAGAMAGGTSENTGWTLPDSQNNANSMGFTATPMFNLTNFTVTKHASDTSTIAQVWLNDTGTCTLQGNVSYSGNTASFGSGLTLIEGKQYMIVSGNNYVTHTKRRQNSISGYPIQNTGLNITNDAYDYPTNHCVQPSSNVGYAFLSYSYDVANPVPPPTVTNFTITAFDSYTGAKINSFGVAMNGTLLGYTSNGTYVTNYLSNFSTLIAVEVLGSVSGYFDDDYFGYNISDSGDITASMHKSEITFYAYNRVTNESITNLTITTTNNTATATNPTLNLSTGTYTATINKSGYYDNSITFTTTNLEQSNKNVSLYDAALNVTINVLSGGATEQNFTIDLYSQNYSYHEQLSTTNGEVRFNITPGTYTLYVNDSYHELTTTNVTINPTSYASLTNTTINVYTTNTFNVSFYNESSNQLLNKTIYLEVISVLGAENYTITNATTEITALIPEEYTLRYYYDSDRPREYYITLQNQSYEDIRLYLIDEDISTAYTPIVNDENDNACSDNTVSLMRYYTDINGYRTVAMAKTDTNGYALFYVRPNVVNYKLYFSGTCGTFTSVPQKIISQADSFTVASAQTYLTSSLAIANASVSLTYVNLTKTFVFDWQDSTNTVTEGCLYVYRTYKGVQSTNYSQCSDGSSGSLIYTITGNTTDKLFQAQGVLDTNTDYSTYNFMSDVVDFTTIRQIWGTTGAFWALIIILSFVLLFGQTLQTMIIATIGSMAIVTVLGILPGAGNVIGALIVVGGIMLYKIRTD